MSDLHFQPASSKPPALRPLSRNDFVPGARAVKAGNKHDQLTEQARKLVAQTFFGAMLQQMRQSPFKSDLFSGGRGGEAFGTVLDQHLAERMSRAAGEKLVRSIVRKLDVPQQRRGEAEPLRPANNPTGYDYSKVKIHVAPALRG